MNNSSVFDKNCEICYKNKFQHPIEKETKEKLKVQVGNEGQNENMKVF